MSLLQTIGLIIGLGLAIFGWDRILFGARHETGDGWMMVVAGCFVLLLTKGVL